jgi:acyl-coenzyme A synthetase/AMP-(fatty) acid ligase
VNLVDMIYFWARTAPHRPAIIQRSMVTTYQGLADGIESIGERIDKLNLDKTEPVAVSIISPPYMFATLFALLRNGYSVAPVSGPRHPFLAAAGVRHVIHDREGLVVSGGRNIRFDPSWLPKPQPGSSRNYKKREAASPNVIFFSSGSTGLPKKIVHSAEALSQRLTLPDACATGAYQKIMILPGPATTYGFHLICEVLNFGKTVCFSIVDWALPLINLFGIEAVVTAPPQALMLAEMRKKNPGYRVDSLKAIFIGGGKIDAEGIRRVRTTLCRNVINVYGAGESGPSMFSPFDAIGDMPGGIPPPWIDAEVVDADDRRLPAGVEGFFRVRTLQLAETLRAAGPDKIAGVRDGWFYSGDIASIGSDGVVRFGGRSSDVINRGGIKVSGARIEEILQALPEIKEAAACGIIGASGIEELWIGIVPNGAIDVERIKSHLSEHQDVQLSPDEVIFLDEIPRGELGKIQKLQLKELMLGMRRGC